MKAKRRRLTAVSCFFSATAKWAMGCRLFQHPASGSDSHCVCVRVCVFADRQDLEDSDKVDVLQEPIVEALKVNLLSLRFPKNVSVSRR